MADISKITALDGTTYNIKDATARSTGKVSGVKGNAESSYRTGNVNLTSANIGAIAKDENGNTKQLRQIAMQGISDVTVRPLINQARANHLAFLPADQIIVEKTTDGGTTWVDAGFSDNEKRHIFAETRAVYKALPQINGQKNILCGLRFTITGMKYNVPANTAETEKYAYWNSTYVQSCERYFSLNNLYFWISSSNDTMSVKVERATGKNPNTWSDAFNNVNYYMNGWSGADFVPLTSSGTFGGGTGQTGNFWNWRITLMTRGVNGTDTMGTGYETQTQTIAEIRGYGDTVWAKPNEYMGFDKMYSHDIDKNVTFPAKVAATSFTGNLTGTATGVESSGAATNSTARHVWFSDSTTETKRAHSDNLKYTPSTNTISSNISGSAAKVNNHTVNSDVPANAKFTDTINTYYGECSSSAYEVEKLVDCDDFTELTAGATINVLFYNVNLALNATLNVNDTGAKKITLETLDGTTADSGLNWPAGVVSFTYDGFTWHLHNPSRLATSTSSGLMSYTDKSKLNNLNKFYLTDTTPSSASSGDLWFIIEEEETIIPGQGDQNASEPSSP